MAAAYNAGFSTPPARLTVPLHTSNEPEGVELQQFETPTA